MTPDRPRRTVVPPTHIAGKGNDRARAERQVLTAMRNRMGEDIAKEQKRTPVGQRITGAKGKEGKAGVFKAGKKR